VPCPRALDGHDGLLPTHNGTLDRKAMPMLLFPEPTGFVEECLTSVGIMLDDNIPHQQLFELAIHVKVELWSTEDAAANCLHYPAVN